MDVSNATIDFGFVTLFPEIIREVSESSVIGIAAKNGLLSYKTANPRDFTYDRHRTVDESPYGGEAGMLLKAEPVALAIESLKMKNAVVIHLDPTGEEFTHFHAVELSKESEIIFLCGRYEGIDHRVVEYFEARNFSIGKFVVTAGDLPALLMADAIARQIPGVLGNGESLLSDSFSDALQGELSAPNYTRPPIWRGIEVPGVLRSGDHKRIKEWRKK